MKQRQHIKKRNKTQKETIYRHAQKTTTHNTRQTNKTTANENNKITNTYTNQNTAHT